MTTEVRFDWMAVNIGLAQLQRDYNSGEPERRGDERNFAKYQERVAEMTGLMRQMRTMSDEAASALSASPAPAGSLLTRSRSA